MDKNRYYFPNFIADDNLSIVVVRAKELLQHNDNIVKIFQNNNDFLYGQSPRQMLFLMKQNNRSIFSSSPSSENPSDSKTNEASSTPVTRNPDSSNFPRRFLQLDDAEKKVSHSRTLETTPFKRQTVLVGVKPKDKIGLTSTVGEKSVDDEQFVCPTGSTGSPEAGNKESPPSAEITKMTANLSMAEKELGGHLKVSGSIEASNQDHPRSSIVSALKNLGTMDNKQLGSPLRTTGNIDSSNQDPLRSAEASLLKSLLTVGNKEIGSPEKIYGSISPNSKESRLLSVITRIVSNLKKDENESRSLIRNEQMAKCSATTTNPVSSKEEAANFTYPGLTKEDFISNAEVMINIPKSITNGNETPSPVKKYKMGNISASDSSSEDNEAIICPIQVDKMNLFPNEARKVMVREEIKRKSLSPKKRNKTLFKTIPRVILSAGKADLDVEVSYDLEDNASPTTSRSSSADYRSDLVKDNISPVLRESRSRTSPKTLEKYLSPAERAISVGSSRNASGSNSPGSDDDVFVGRYASVFPSIVATSEKSYKYESVSSDGESDTVLLTHTILKFNTLLILRDQIVKKIFKSLLNFQENIQFLCSYVNNVRFVVMNLSLASAEYSTMELKDTLHEAFAVISKLLPKLTSWKTDIDSDVGTWQKCFEQIQQLKEQYEPLFSFEGKPIVPLEVVQVYEYEIKAIWKRMDDMIMMADSRRALFSHIARDFEKIIKMMVKCLILVGVLLPR